MIKNDVETRFIKYSKSIISPIINDLFNLCVNKDVFPNFLKIAEIIPIYKKDDINIATNYGSTVLLFQFNKIKVEPPQSGNHWTLNLPDHENSKL